MQADTANEWTRLAPPFSAPAESDAAFFAFAKRLSKLDSQDASMLQREIDSSVQSFLDGEHGWPKKDRPLLKAAALVVADLTTQGWQLRIRRGVVEVRPPEEILADSAAEKARIRRQELIKRDAQLRQPAAASFIRSMERRSLHQGRFVSIFSLIRDGRHLANALRSARAQGSPGALESVIDPYLQFVSPGERCAWTGLDLHDVWRYFRHTWSNQYTSVPGRSMMFLVRDRAAEFHPVIGIGALCSPVMQIRERDEWIGWHPSKFIEELRANPTPRMMSWLERIVTDAIAEIFFDDLLADKIISTQALRSPDPAVLRRLIEEGLSQRGMHYRFVEAQQHKKVGQGAEDSSRWIERARMHLFRSKRALTLADLLNARMVLAEHKRGSPADSLRALLESADGIRVVKKILKKAKADRVGIAMADISVCGAVAPYNAILGGKLVSMLAASPEVVQAYRDRYSMAESEIASSMAGRPIVRKPALVYLGTTSLYGVGSSQYNRIQIPCEQLGGRPGSSIRYQELGHSESFGTSQYSDDTVDALVDLVQQRSGGQRVNSIFGEGVSPKLRKVREGLDALGFPSERLLRHGRRRIIYAVSLIENVRDFLLGLDSDPRYLAPLDSPTPTKAIAHWWKQRWLRSRIENDSVLDEVARHTLIHPIRHGARVVLPKDERQQMLPLPTEF